MKNRIALFLGMSCILSWGLIACPAQAAAGELAWAVAPGGLTTNDGAEAMALDSSGNVLIAGYFQGSIDMDPGAGTATLTSAGNRDIFVLKLDPDGNFLWAHGFGNTNNDEGGGVAVDASGNVYVSGYFRDTVDFDPGVGVQNLVSAGNEEVFLLKLDSAGDFVWARRLGGVLRELCFGVAVDSDANVYTTGSYSGTVDFDPGAGTANLSSVGAIDVFVSKLDSAGDYVWARSMGGSGSDEGRDLTVDPAGNVYLTGYFEVTADFDPGAGTSNLTSNGNNDVFIEKLDSNGDLVWVRSIGGTGADQGLDIAVDMDGNVLTTGPFSSPTIDLDPGTGTASFSNAGAADAFFQKLDAGGDFVWAYAFGGLGVDLANGIVVDSEGAVYSTGRYKGTIDFDPGAAVLELSSAANSFDYYVQKYDTAGNLDWVRSIGAPGISDTDEGKCIAVDSEGAVYTAGYFSSTVDFDPGLNVNEITSAGGRDLFVQKLVPDVTGPTATSITPDVSSPTNADTINFTVVFDESVTNFDDVSDLTIVHSGTTHTSVSITGGPSTYNVEMGGISGNGLMNLSVNVGSDVTDFAPNPLSSSVTRFVSIDNTPPTFGNLAVNPGVGSVGTSIEISFDTPSALDGDPIVTVNGHAATMTSKGNVLFTYQYSVLPSDPIGFATVSVSGVDPAGNAGSTSSNSLLEIVESSIPVPGVPVAAWPAVVLLLAVATRALRRRE